MSPRAPRQLTEIVDAAARAFATKGYRRTQMSDIASELGISAGNLYNYVPGKETLFALVLHRGVGDPGDELPAGLPVRQVSIAEAVTWLSGRLDFVSDFPVMEAALAGPPPDDVTAEARAVVLELYDVLSRMASLVAVIEASAPDLPELATYFAGLRREAFDRLARYVESRSRSGAFRELDDPAVTARLVHELVNWSAARHPRSDDPESLPPEAARNATADIAVHALVSA